MDLSSTPTMSGLLGAVGRGAITGAGLSRWHQCRDGPFAVKKKGHGCGCEH
eukprot:SAG25_NODE_410_length_8423_cov_2.086617_3_plen_51_part_00